MMPHVLPGRPGRALALLLVALLALALLPAAPARAATSKIVKTSAGDTELDDGACSLREVLQALYAPLNDDCGSVSSPLTITFDAPGTIQLKKGAEFPNISGDKIVTITGPVIIDGRDQNGVSGNIFDIDNGVLNLANLTLTKGSRAVTVNAGGTFNAAGVSFLDNFQDGSGGGAILSNGKVNIAGSLFTANTAPGANGNGGAIIALGNDQLNVAGTIFNGNRAKNSGGAIYATTGVNLVDVIFNGNVAEADDNDDDAFDEGGGVLFLQTDQEDERLTITRGVFNGNLSPEGSGGALHLGLDVPATIRDSSFNGNIAGPLSADSAGGAIWSGADLDLLHSTLLNNAAAGDGGAIANDRRGALAISNSTLIANAAGDQGGGIATLNSQGGSNIRPQTTALNVTLALNAAGGGDGSGGGLFSQEPTPSYPEVTVLGNTIITGSDAVGGNCGGGAYTSRGGNLDGAATCGLSAGESNLAANLDAPAFNGGPIPTLLTMKPLPGSAALDAGVASICADEPVAGEDQTGAPRNQDGDGDGGSGCDIGALEGPAAVPGFGSSPVAPGPLLLGNATVGAEPPLAASISVFNTGTAPLTLGAGGISGSAAADFALSTALPQTIAPGGPAVALGLTCQPSAVGVRSAGLQLSTNDPANPTVTFELRCNGTPTPAPGFGAAPEAPGPVSVGAVRLGETGSTTVLLKETGTADLRIDSLSLGGLNPGDFALGSAGPLDIPDGAGPLPLAVSCTPTATGARSATLTVETNDPSRPSVDFSLVCVGRSPLQDVFEPAGGSRPSVSPDNRGPYGVAVSPDGAHIYVADRNFNSNGGFVNSSVGRYTRDAQGYPAGGIHYVDGLAGGDQLGGAWVPLVSPDGRFVYVAAGQDNAVSVFERNTDTGALALQGSVAYNDSYGTICPIPAGCPRIRGLENPYAMQISPDGRHIYVSGVDSDSITVLLRNQETGGLRNIFGRAAVVQEYVDETAETLNSLYGLALSPDGKHLYATGYVSDSLAVFARDQTTGRITLVPGAVYRRDSIPSLNGVFRVTLSPDGRFVYTASYDGAAVTAFRRDVSTGVLSLVAGYVYGQGELESLGPATAVAVSLDGRYLFATSYSGAVSIFERDGDSGELNLLQTIKRGANNQPPIAGARDVAVAPDGRMIFVSGYLDDQLTGFALANPRPALSSLEPASAVAGSPELLLVVNGEGFAPGATVTWDGADLPTDLISAGELRATVSADRLDTAGSAAVGVRNPAPGGGPAANPLPFTITAPNQNPVPSLDRAEPAGAAAGDPALTANIFGSGFVPGAVVLWNGQPRPTTFVGPTALQVVLDAADLAQPGVNALAVRNPAPGGGSSNGVAFEVAGPGESPPPAVTGLAPSSAIAGSVTGELAVTVSGSGFAPGAQARWNGVPRPTTFVGPGELRVAIGAADLLSPGVAAVDVLGPDGDASNAALFTIGAPGDQPVPGVSGARIGPGTGGSFSVTVTGSSFVAGATVRWNGQSYTPSALNAEQLSFSLPAAAYRSATLVVVNPGPGGGPSNELLVTIRRLAIPALRR